MVQPGGDKVLVNNLLTGIHKRANVTSAALRDRIKREILLCRRVYCHSRGGVGEVSAARVWGGHGIEVSNALRLADCFVVCKKESAAFDDRPPHRAAELIALEG